MLQSVEIVNRWCLRLLKLVCLNFIWMGVTLIGLGVFTIGPATYAMFSLIRQWVRGNEDQPLVSTFIRYFKENYRESVLVSWLLIAGGIILVVDLLHISSWYLRVVIWIAVFFYLIAAIYIFPTMVHYNWKSFRLKLKMSFILGFSHLQYTLVLIVVISLVTLLVASILPSIVTFFGVSVIAYLIMWTANQVFQRVEQKNI